MTSSTQIWKSILFCGLILYCTVHVPLDTQECSTVSTPNQILYGTLQIASLSRFLKTMPELIDLLCGTVLTAHTVLGSGCRFCRKSEPQLRALRKVVARTSLWNPEPKPVKVKAKICVKLLLDTCKSQVLVWSSPEPLKMPCPTLINLYQQSLAAQRQGQLVMLRVISVLFFSFLFQAASEHCRRHQHQQLLKLAPMDLSCILRVNVEIWS